MYNGLAEFQEAAARRIIERLRDTRGSRRFLLADEVGLGKTRVAAEVIKELSAVKRNGFTAVYVCSSAEIAEQNREKLSPPNVQAAVKRLSLLALQSSEIESKRQENGIQLFSFTPGTSLHVGNATGIAYERRLLLYLLGRVWHKRVNLRKWRQYFRCSAKEEPWFIITQFSKQQAEFRSPRNKISLKLQRELRDEWNKSSVKLVDPKTGKPGTQKYRLADVVDDLIDAFAINSDSIAKRNAKIVIGELRRGLSRVALDFLQPDLVMLDEFQRFKEILVESRDLNTLVGHLLGHRGRPILIMSATPYKMYTDDSDTEDHETAFLETVRFLWDGGQQIETEATIARLQQNLRSFKTVLLSAEDFDKDHTKLFSLKAAIEKDLQPVMCRTERNHHLDDVQKGVQECFTDHGPAAVPTVAELRHYVQLKQFLRHQKLEEWNITDFWKSAPLPLAFMDAHYRLIQKLRDGKVVIPKLLLPGGRILAATAPEHLKIRQLTRRTLGEANEKLRCLWIKPSYTYYPDTFYGTDDPKKLLVFSHWKFVPKAVSILLSQEAEGRLGRRKRTHLSVPLRFREPLAFSFFDVCYPSPVLADIINPARFAFVAGHSVTNRELHRQAVQAARKLVRANGIGESPTRRFPLWQIMARVEALSSHNRTIRTGVCHVEVGKAGHETEVSDQYHRYRKQYLRWMDDKDTPLEISDKDVRRLALIALFSPAVCLLRSMRDVFPELEKWEERDWSGVLAVGLNQLRNYFNKWTVQAVIRAQTGRLPSYVAKVLSYCERAHLAAVLDEYSYLLSIAIPSGQPAKMPGLFLRQVGGVFGIGTGSPSLNVLTRGGRIRVRPSPRPAHYAVAFGDDVAADAAALGGRTRKTVMRESFNSPFWPFVLATTSVGQEGLDFHLYCCDIMHWNLPSNPVDLEQREGRINRFDGLNIRRDIALEYNLAHLSGASGAGNIWARAFQRLDPNPERTKHGLYPHWIYENAEGVGSTIRRHLSFYSTSSDNYRYENLKYALALYRLVFGQPRQQDIIDDLLKKHPETDLAELRRKLTKYTINLSPISSAAGSHSANMSSDRHQGPL